MCHRPIRRRAVGRPARLIGRRCIECGASALSIARNRTTIRSLERVGIPPPSPPSPPSCPLAPLAPMIPRTARSSLARAEERGQCRAPRAETGALSSRADRGRGGRRVRWIDGRRGNLMSFQGCKCHRYRRRRARAAISRRARARSITTWRRAGDATCPAYREDDAVSRARARVTAAYACFVRTALIFFFGLFHVICLCRCIRKEADMRPRDKSK